MKTVPASKTNPKAKQAVILFAQLTPRQLEGGKYHAYKLHTTPANTTSPIYRLSVLFLLKEPLKSGLSSGAGFKQY